ncbi:hypothetical protein B0H14DRAFT_2590588 [Mycena olivaceomarginata]|nr:hypothetical protein B0H14DRAFT_2590588 [Mycena olivaceomarginata]
MTKSVKLRGGGSADVIIPQDNPPAKKIHSAAHLQLVEAETYLVATQATEHGLFMKLSGALVAGCRGVVIGECHKGNSVSSATKATNAEDEVAGDEVAEQKRDGSKNRSRARDLTLLPPSSLRPSSLRWFPSSQCELLPHALQPPTSPPQAHDRHTMVRRRNLLSVPPVPMSRESAGFTMTCADAPLGACIIVSCVVPPCTTAGVVGGMDWVFGGSLSAVVVGGTDWGLWGMRKARVDACTLPAPYFSVEHGVRDGGHAKRGFSPTLTEKHGRCGTDPIHQLPSTHKQRRVPRTPLSGRLRFGLSPLFSPWYPRPRHRQEHTTFKLAHPSAPGPLSTDMNGFACGSHTEQCL